MNDFNFEKKYLPFILVGAGFLVVEALAVTLISQKPVPAPIPENRDQVLEKAITKEPDVSTQSDVPILEPIKRIFGKDFKDDDAYLKAAYFPDFTGKFSFSQPKIMTALVQDANYYGVPPNPNLFQLESRNTQPTGLHYFAFSRKYDLNQYLGRKVRVNYREIVGDVWGEQQVVMVDTLKLVPLTLGEAVELVKSQPEVREWLTLFANGGKSKLGGRPVVAFDHQQGSIYVLRVYEDLPDHTASFNWYNVDSESGKVTREFNY